MRAGHSVHHVCHAKASPSDPTLRHPHRCLQARRRERQRPPSSARLERSGSADGRTLTHPRGSGQITSHTGDPIVIGLRLNNYEIASVIGEGGMGTVYLARHTFTGRKAAVKLLHSQLTQDQVLVARFMNEARATAAIGHPNIIDIIDVGFLPDGRTPYLMMEFLEGESLGKRLQRDRPLPIDEAIGIACQTASALSAAHACDIVHRDLKPDNLFLVPDPSMQPLRLRVKVLDFGIAKLRGELSAGSVKTRTGTIMGTPLYMSPEQCRGFAQNIDNRTDIYTLGIILYEMVCGSPPFVSEGLGDLLVMHIGNQPAPPRTLNADVPGAVEAAIMRALAKDPDQRFASMADFQEALRSANRPSIGSSPVSAETPRAPRQVPERETAASGAASTGSPAAISWVETPSTTLTSTTGQVLTGKPTQRVRPGVRRAVLAGGVLVTAALVVYAAVPHKGGQTANPRDAESTSPVRGAASVLHSTAPFLPSARPPDAALAAATARPPDAAPLPAAEHATKLATNKSQPAKPGGKRPNRTAAKQDAQKGEEKNTANVGTATSTAIKHEPAKRW
jgi:eukaryotic-like serine/threonine-protein kinase